MHKKNKATFVASQSAPDPDRNRGTTVAGHPDLIGTCLPITVNNPFKIFAAFLFF